MMDQLAIKSPCIGVCTMDDFSGLCLGCFRTIDEIQAWWDMAPAAQQQVILAAGLRQIDQAEFD